MVAWPSRHSSICIRWSTQLAATHRHTREKSHFPSFANRRFHSHMQMSSNQMAWHELSRFRSVRLVEVNKRLVRPLCQSVSWLVSLSTLLYKEDTMNELFPTCSQSPMTLERTPNIIIHHMWWSNKYYNRGRREKSVIRRSTWSNKQCLRGASAHWRYGYTFQLWDLRVGIEGSYDPIRITNQTGRTRIGRFWISILAYHLWQESKPKYTFRLLRNHRLFVVQWKFHDSKVKTSIKGVISLHTLQSAEAKPSSWQQSRFLPKEKSLLLEKEILTWLAKVFQGSKITRIRWHTQHQTLTANTRE